MIINLSLHLYVHKRKLEITILLSCMRLSWIVWVACAKSWWLYALDFMHGICLWLCMIWCLCMTTPHHALKAPWFFLCLWERHNNFHKGREKPKTSATIVLRKTLTASLSIQNLMVFQPFFVGLGNEP